MLPSFNNLPRASRLSVRDERREVLQPRRQCSFPVSVPQNPNVYLVELILVDEIKPIVQERFARVEMGIMQTRWADTDANILTRPEPARQDLAAGIAE